MPGAKLGDHFYTSSATERDDSVAHNGYQDEGIAGYVFATQTLGTIPLYRLFKVVDSGELDEITLSNVQFDLDHAVIGPRHIMNQASQVLINNSDIEQEQTFTLEVDYTETRRWSTNLDIKTNIQTTINAGVPSFAKGQIQIGAEVSSSITWETEETKTTKYSQAIPVKVPANSGIDCEASVSMSKVTIPLLKSTVKCCYP